MKTKGTARLLRKARALSSLLLVLAMIASLPGMLSPSVAQAASQTLENTELKVVFDDSDWLMVREFYYKPIDVTTNHMPLARMGLKYDGTFRWFSDLPGAGTQTLLTTDGKLRLDLSATAVGSNPFFTTSVTVSTLGGNSVSNLTLFQGSDEDIHGSPAQDIGLYIPEVDAVVAYDSGNTNFYLGFAGSLHSAARHVNGTSDLWDKVAADDLNNESSYGPADIGLAEKWNLGNVAAGGTVTLKVTWAVGTNLDQFKANIIAGDSTAPTMQSSTLTSPNGGESWAGGSTHTITWNPAHITDPTLKTSPITLDYKDGAGLWVQIATNEANDGSYAWQVPSLDIASKIKITATDLATNTASDESDGNFAIDSTNPTVNLTYAPNRTVRDADTLTITATFSEAMTSAPTIAIDAPGTDGDVAATAMTIGANASVWAYSYNVPAGSDGAATVTISGTDLSGHSNQAATNNTFTIDNVAPTVALTYSDADRLVKQGDALIITANFSEAMAASPTIAIDTSGADLGTTAMAGGPAIWTYSYNVPAGSDGTATVTVSGADLATNTNQAATNNTFTIDNTAPTLPAGNIVGTTVQGAGDTIALTFSEPVLPATAPWSADELASIQSPDGTPVAFASATFAYVGNTLTITLNEAAPDGAYLVNGNVIAVTPAANAIKDVAGNPLAAAEVVGTTLNRSDDAPPTVVLSYNPDRPVKDTDTLVITATFNEAMVWATPTIAINTTFIDLPATNMTMVGGDNKVWRYSYDVPPASDGTATVTISGTDLAGNLNLPATNNTFTIDNTAPTLPTTNIVGATRQGEGDTIALTFSEPVVAADNAWSANEFSAIESPDGAALNIANATFDYVVNTLTITLDSAYLVNGNTIAVTPATSKITDRAGNPLPDTEVVGSTVNSGDSAAPTVALTYALNRPVKDADTLVITATFSEAMAASPAIAIDAPGVAGDVAAIAMTVTVGTENKVWTYSYNVPAGSDGTATVAISGTDLAGNANQAATTNTFTIDNGPAPTLATANIVGTTVQGGGDTIALTFSEAVAAANNDWQAAFTSIESPDGTPLNMAHAAFSYSGSILTITLDEAADGAYLVNGNTIAVTPALDKITDVAANSLANVEVVGNTAVSGDSARPTVSLAYAPDHAVKDSDNLVVTATFSEDMVWTTPTIAIATQGDGDLVATPMTMVGGNRAVWSYTWDVAFGSDDDGAAAVTIAGTDLAGNPNQAATNGTFTIDNTAPTLSAANIVGTTRQGQGDTIAITFSEPMVAADNAWSANELASIQSPDGTALTFANAGFAYSGNTLTITLNEATDNSYLAYLVNGKTVAVTPAPGKITDIAGNPLANAEVVGTTLNTGDTARPTATLTYAPNRTVRDADTLVITASFSEAMATEPTIFIDTQGIDLTGAMVRGANNTTWTYTYDVPPGSDGAAMVIVYGADLAGNSVEVTFNSTFRINNTSPTLSVASIAGTTRQGQNDTIVLTFSEPVVAPSGWAGAFSSIESPDGAALNIAHAAFSYSGSTLTITLDEATDGAYLVNGNLIAVAPGVGKITDIAGNALASDEVVGSAAVSGDNATPTVALTYALNRPVRDADTLAITATFSEAMASTPTIAINTTLLDLPAIAMTMVGTDRTVWSYSYDVPSGSTGAATVTISGADVAGNSNQAATNSTFTIDNTPPSVSLSSTASEPTGVSPIPVTVTFSEAVTGFSIADITVGNGTAGDFTAVSGTVYRFTVTPAAQAAVTVNVGAGVAQDSAGNGNSAAAQLSRTYRLLPTLVLTSPNGGEDWPIGSTQTITWSAYGLNGLVRIELSHDGGATWRTIVSRTRNDGSHTWTVSGPATTQARARISSISNRGVSDTSGAGFTISVPAIAVTSPVFPTTWDIGDRETITWTTPVFSGLVRIELSRDGGLTWQTIVSRTANDGSYIWTVRGPATTLALIRVTSLSTGGSDTNDVSFTIRP